ncbi:DUF1937 family protein [Aminobacterium sp. EBM-42]|uniref:DUF1937 family protein n=1 Tax=Aminobacterium sp. EBM-42 TaxID=1918503 RepID=UPI00338E9A8B
MLNSQPGDWSFWEGLDIEFVKWADELWVVRLDGWKRSIGVMTEIQKAKELGKVIRYI